MTRFPRPIAVAGAAWVLPGDLSWADVLAGRSAVQLLSNDYPVPVGAPLALPLVPPNSWPHALMPRGLALAQTALDRLSRDPDRRYALVLGLPNLFSDAEYLERVLPGRNDAAALRPLVPFASSEALHFLADQVGPGLPRLRLDAACATGNDAIAAACQWLHAGTVDDVLVVASCALLNPICLALFHNLKALSDLADPAASCPFDDRRRGFVMGEGAAGLWLSNRPPTQPLGYVAGFGQSMSANHFVDPPENTDAWAVAAGGALDGLPEPNALAYVSAHGTATRAGDRAETRLMHRLLGRRAPDVPTSSVKSMLGHTLAAAALIEAVVCLYALRDQMAPPTAHLQVPDPECDLDYVPLQAKPIRGSHALSNAFGFGGHNSCVLFAGATS